MNNNFWINVFLGWIAFQLVALSLALSFGYRALVNGTYDCHMNQTEVRLDDGSTYWVHDKLGFLDTAFISVLVPIYVFIPTDFQFLSKKLAFCEGK